MSKRHLLLLALPMLLASCGGGGQSSSAQETEEQEPIVLLDPSAPDYVYSGNDSCETSYEIFVGSFADSNDDGVGDLKGIEEHLGYLQELGVKNLWLTPVHPSPTYHKYDVNDYYAVDPSFGTVEDFVSLTSKAKEKGMRVFMDMVFNHSCLQNSWFRKACDDLFNGNEGEDSYADLYSMSLNADEVPNTKYSYSYQGQTIWYEGNFSSNMPEFNLDSPIARKLHKEIMGFWLDKGAEGFRFDGVAYYYYGNEKRNAEYTRYLSEAAKSLYEDVYLVAEYWLDEQTYLNTIAGAGMTAFNFATCKSKPGYNADVATSSESGRRYAAAVANAQKGFLEASEGKIQPSFFLTNHDMDRWAGNKTPERVKAIASLNILTPGTPYLYYGEEIGLLGSRATAATDANRRLPMQWVSNADQDTARTVASSESDYKGPQTSAGALEDIASDTTLTGFYKKLLHFRASHEDLKKGSYVNATPQDAPIAAFKVFHQGKQAFLVTNVSQDAIEVTVPSGLKGDFSLSQGTSSLEGATLKLAAYSTAYLTLSA